ncbi:PepSY domain-containing protein [Sphingomonas sp. H160509]|uniref:PepSY domain-containing protein n=1 Tax=Sphingomonas sp. H160509 TaxID=2955313 RepID=UPI00315949CB
MSSDAADRPLRSDAQVDGATGRLVGRVAFADRHWIDRVIGYGIAAHEGALFGIANQILGTLTALLLTVLAVSGGIMWWRRRPTGLLGAPLPQNRPRFRIGLVAAIVGLGVYMPLFGTTLVIVLLVERVVLRRIAKTRRWLGLGRAASS